MISQIWSNMLVSGFFSIKSTQINILKYLNVNQMNSLYWAISYNDSDNENIKSQLRKLIKAFILHKDYINNVDRGMYYSIYDNQQFTMKIDQISILNIAYSYQKQSSLLINTYNQLFNSLRINAKMTYYQIKLIKQMITDPAMSLPTLLRDRARKHLKNVYQGFVYNQTRNQDNNEYYDEFYSFKKLIKQNQQKYIRQAILPINNNKINVNKSILQKIYKIINSSFNVNKSQYGDDDNYNDQEEQNNNNGDQGQYIHIEQYNKNEQLFNFVIIMFKLVENMLSSYKIYLKSIDHDRYIQLIQLLVKFSTFKYFITQIEQQLGCVFKLFKIIVQDTPYYNNEQTYNIQNLQLFQILIAMFYTQLKQQIHLSFQAYNSLLYKFRITNQFKLNNQKQKNNDYRPFCGFESLTLQSILSSQDQFQTIKYLINNYSQMFVDISLNKSNITWNGHSDQKMGQAYIKFEEKFIQTEISFILNLVKNNFNRNIKDILIEQLNLLKHQLNINSRTIKAIIKQANIQMIVNYDFTEIDNEIQKLNEQYSTKSQQKKNFKIYDSHSTSASSNDQQQNLWQYVSQVSEHNIIQNNEIDIQM